MTQHYYALILAGGGGTRLWPMSRKDTPKQMLPLITEASLFQTSVERLEPLFKPENIFVVTGQNYVDSLRESTPHVPAQNFIVEPFGRDNAAATALGLATIEKHDPEAVVAILTADHHIAREDTFRDVLEGAYEIAQQGSIVTLGISPSFPATGFGYIQQGRRLGTAKGFIYHEATRFTEKPDIVRATQFLASRQYSWNSGMFIWHVKTALAEFERQQPKIFSLMRDIQDAIGTPDYGPCLVDAWNQMPKKSIDYAIMEGAKNMTVVPIDIGWSDVGSWASLFDVLPQDGFGNCSKGRSSENRVILDTRDTLVVSDRLTVTIGVENLVVVETEDVLLICHKDRTQDIKKIVDYLREQGNDAYL
jgi:mannose-1-phosphate guanylyltransferase